MGKFNQILPGNPRYQPKEMIGVFGYDNLYKKVALVEIATLETLGDIGIISKENIALLDDKTKEGLLNLKTTDVDKIEREITNHDIRAWVRSAQDILDKRLVKWVHIPLTSYDVIDTARILQFREAYSGAIKPSLEKVIELFSNLAQDNINQVQIGRTHGQHALPITVGFWLATILNRIVYNYERIFSDFPTFFNGNRSARLVDSFSTSNPNGKYPALSQTITNSETQPNSFFIEDGSFMRIKNVQLGYTLPKKILEKMGMSSLRIYLQGTNLLTITGYKGFDPEVVSNDNLSLGIDFNTFPVSQIFSIGANIKF